MIRPCCSHRPACCTPCVSPGCGRISQALPPRPTASVSTHLSTARAPTHRPFRCSCHSPLCPRSARECISRAPHTPSAAIQDVVVACVRVSVKRLRVARSGLWWRRGPRQARACRSPPGDQPTSEDIYHGQGGRELILAGVERVDGGPVVAQFRADERAGPRAHVQRRGGAAESLTCSGRKAKDPARPRAVFIVDIISAQRHADGSAQIIGYPASERRPGNTLFLSVVGLNPHGGLAELAPQQ